MKKLTLAIFIVILLAACTDASQDIIVQNNEVGSDQEENLDDKDENKEVEQKQDNITEEKQNDADVDAKDDAQIETKEELNTKPHLISWGHKKTNGRTVDTIIIHSVYNPFDGGKHSLDEVLAIFKGYGVAPHYIIERDGTVNQVVAEKDIAWQAGRSRVPDGRTQVNNFSIGIEMVNSLDDTYTKAQYTSLRTLIRDIKDRHSIKYVLGHDEIAVQDPWNFEWSEVNEFRHEAR